VWDRRRRRAPAPRESAEHLGPGCCASPRDQGALQARRGGRRGGAWEGHRAKVGSEGTRAGADNVGVSGAKEPPPPLPPRGARSGHAPAAARRHRQRPGPPRLAVLSSLLRAQHRLTMKRRAQPRQHRRCDAQVRDGARPRTSASARPPRGPPPPAPRRRSPRRSSAPGGRAPSRRCSIIHRPGGAPLRALPCATRERHAVRTRTPPGGARATTASRPRLRARASSVDPRAPRAAAGRCAARCRRRARCSSGGAARARLPGAASCHRGVIVVQARGAACRAGG